MAQLIQQSINDRSINDSVSLLIYVVKGLDAHGISCNMFTVASSILIANSVADAAVTSHRFCAYKAKAGHLTTVHAHLVLK